MKNLFRATSEERVLIEKIATRAVELCHKGGIRIKVDRLSLMMDIEATHCNSYRLRLQELLDADKSNFIHDVFGIRAYIDRETGKICNEFVPRFTDTSAEYSIEETPENYEEFSDA